MKKVTLLIFLLLTGISFAQQQTGTFTINPAAFGENDQITITVTGIDTSIWGVGDVYLWAWYFDSPTSTTATNSPTNGTWENSNEAQKMTNNGDGSFSFTMTPSTFYNATGIDRIGMLVKAKDGTNDKKTQDNVVSVGAFQLTLTNPTNDPVILNSGDNLTISATTSIAADFILTANGVQINSSATASTSYAYTHTNITQNTSLQLQATNAGDTITRNFDAVIRPTVIEEAVPAGLLDGINLDPLDNTRASLVLYAPGKEFVHVIGDFNNWQIDNAYVMKKDSTKDRFWIELTGLTPQFDHLYQYLVEFDINIADPYSTLLLDGYGNDSFIDATTYPNIPTYPSSQTEAITVLRTGEPDYVWQIPDFQQPKKTDLVIYELLIRDFDALHSFDAVKNRLDYLEGLGINAIGLMPINEYDGNESWGYNPSFHMALDKYYGTKDAFKAFIDECHVRGIAVLLDVVYNHATGQHPYYRMWNTDNGGTGGQASADNPFFNATAKHSYNVFNDFNHQSQATKDYVNRTVAYWIDEYKIDGMRWDLTKGFTQNCSESDENCTNSTQADRVAVLQGYADNQWAANPDFYVIFEHLGGIQEEEQWANYRINEGKGIMLWNKQTEAANEATLGYHEGGKSDFSGVSYIQKGFAQPSAISYMESHDEERLMFKNLEFGNSAGDYNVKDLNTALGRMEAAGALFFTVPGPKMIWQFGELGYDVSIDFNGRVGNKPIRWEYANDPNRKKIYNTWSRINKMKVSEPIFETTNFTLDLGNTNGLKKIQLTYDAATGNEIKYITIIANFGVATQSINPSFQETGTWHELIDGNTPYEVANTSSEITLAPGEYRVYGNNPFINANDLDDDGVPNASDLICPNTPFGATVDVTGCEIFSLAPDNFEVSTFSETCRSSNNGSIAIAAIANYNYTATLTGDGTVSNTFTTATEFTDLSAGTYTVCIAIEGQADYRQCYDINITEPEDLSVSSKIDTSSGKISLSLAGGSVYTITLNDKVFTTTSSEFSLNITAQTNKLTVKTDKDCQGIYEETIIMAQDVLVYPNPIKNNRLFVNLGQLNESKVNIELYNMTGKLLFSNDYEVDNGRVQMDMSAISNGMFLLNINTQYKTLQYKIVK